MQRIESLFFLVSFPILVYFISFHENASKQKLNEATSCGVNMDNWSGVKWDIEKFKILVSLGWIQIY